MGSTVVAHGLSCSTQHVGSSWTTASSEPAGRFFTTEPPGKPLKTFLFSKILTPLHILVHLGISLLRVVPNQLPDDHHALCYTKKGIKYSSLCKWLTWQPGDGSQGVASVKRCALLQEKGQKTRARAPES